MRAIFNAGPVAQQIDQLLTSARIEEQMSLSELVLSAVGSSPMSVLVEEIEANYSSGIAHLAASIIQERLDLICYLNTKRFSYIRGKARSYSDFRPRSSYLMQEFAQKVASKVADDFSYIFPSGSVVSLMKAGFNLPSAMLFTLEVNTTRFWLPNRCTGHTLGEILPTPKLNDAIFRVTGMRVVDSYHRLPTVMPKKLDPKSSIMGLMTYFFAYFHLSASESSTITEELLGEISYLYSPEFILWSATHAISPMVSEKHAVNALGIHGGPANKAFESLFCDNPEELEFIFSLIPLFFSEGDARLRQMPNIEPTALLHFFRDEDAVFWKQAERYLGLNVMANMYDDIFKSKFGNKSC